MENGDLASIPNQATNDFLLSLFHNPSGIQWIGGRKEEGVWKWTDGTPWHFENWDTNRPSNLNKKKYLAIHIRTGKWSDEKGEKNPETIICQYTPGKGMTFSHNHNPSFINNM